MAVAMLQQYFQRIDMNEPGIISYCNIRWDAVFFNGREVFRSEHARTTTDFLKQAYRGLGIRYPKFYKMDLYSKLAMVAADVLIGRTSGFHDVEPAQTGVVLSNASASLDTDRKYQETISPEGEWFPSPAVFVYTLPNIMTGEICIRHKITGEQNFFISRYFDPEWMEFYIKSMFEDEFVKQCLGGWVDIGQAGENYRAFLFIVNRGNNISFTAENLEKLYKS